MKQRTNAQRGKRLRFARLQFTWQSLGRQSSTFERYCHTHQDFCRLDQPMWGHDQMALSIKMDALLAAVAGKVPFQIQYVQGIAAHLGDHTACRIFRITASGVQDLYPVNMMGETRKHSSIQAGDTAAKRRLRVQPGAPWAHISLPLQFGPTAPGLDKHQNMVIRCLFLNDRGSWQPGHDASHARISEERAVTAAKQEQRRLLFGA